MVRSRAYPPAVPGAGTWLEKLGSLVMAARLEGAGWEEVRLSVPPSADGPRLGRGLDWAVCLSAALDHGGPFLDGRERRAAYARAAETGVAPAERARLREGLVSLLLELAGRHPAYRYDGIWNDSPGNHDLVARTGDRWLVIEAKGITGSGGTIDWGRARVDATSLALGIHPPGPDMRWGVLIPDDRADAPARGGFVATLVRAWPDARPADDRCPVFLVDRAGAIVETSVERLRLDGSGAA